MQDEVKVMNNGTPNIQQRLRRLSVLFGTAIFLHGVADPAVTYVSINLFNVGYETNPFIRQGLQAGALGFFILHLPLYIITIGAFAGISWLIKIADGPTQTRLYYFSLIITGGIVLWGILIVGWNLLVLINGL